MRPLEKIRARSHAVLRILWHRGLEIRGIRSTLLAIVPRTLEAARRLRGAPRTHIEPSPLEDALVSPERFVPEFQSDVPWARAHLERYEFAVRCLSNSDTVLDIACGAGYGTDLLSRHCRLAVGMDKSRAAIAYAQRTFDGSYVVADFFERPRGMEVFDAAVAFETIEHIDARMVRILKALVARASKVIIGSVPYRESPGNSFHKHFMLTEEDLAPLRRYGELSVYYQEKEPGYRILSERPDQAQNLVFVLRRKESL